MAEIRQKSGMSVVQNMYIDHGDDARLPNVPVQSGFGWMVVRFVRVIRVPACARVSRVSRVCPGSPRCLSTGTVFQHMTKK